MGITEGGRKTAESYPAKVGECVRFIDYRYQHTELVGFIHNITLHTFTISNYNPHSSPPSFFQKVKTVYDRRKIRVLEKDAP